MKKDEPSEDQKTKAVTVTLPVDLLARVDAHAESERRSRSNAIAVLLEERLATKGGAA